jgi:hypothetical protein
MPKLLASLQMMVPLNPTFPWLVLSTPLRKLMDSNQTIAGDRFEEVGTMKLAPVHWPRVTGLEHAHCKPQRPLSA